VRLADAEPPRGDEEGSVAQWSRAMPFAMPASRRTTEQLARVGREALDVDDWGFDSRTG